MSSRRPLLVAALVVAGLLLSRSPAQACHDAGQQQLFPLGTTGSDLVALAVSQQRGGDERARWEVDAQLVRIAPDSTITVLAAVLKRSFDKHADHTRALEQALGKALQLARRHRGFRAATMTTHIECEHQRRCGGAKLTSRGGDLVIAAPGGKTTVVPAGDLDRLYNHPDDYEIAALRRFRAGSSWWSVIDIRAGNPRCDSLVSPKAARDCARPKRRALPVGPIARSYRWRQVYHHGFERAVAVPVRRK